MVDTQKSIEKKYRGYRLFEAGVARDGGKACAD
jgi:hypothetical protein